MRWAVESYYIERLLRNDFELKNQAQQLWAYWDTAYVKPPWEHCVHFGSLNPLCSSSTLILIVPKKVLIAEYLSCEPIPSNYHVMQ